MASRRTSFVGDNKILYKNVKMTGRDSGDVEVVKKKKSITLKNGMAKKDLLWNVGSQVRTLSDDSVILVSASVIWKGEVGAGDVLSCTLNVIEGPG